MITRAIPSSGELIPCIGLGTWIQFDVGKSIEERLPLKDVLTLMTQRKIKLIDTSPMYAKAETVIGELVSELNIADKFFYATKVWTTGKEEGIRQMESSMSKLQCKTLDLIQVHNLVDWKTHLATLRQWKEEGKVRYIGITHYTVSSHEILEQVMRSEMIDFVQFNYSIRVRNAEKRLLNYARDRGVAVIINEPLEKGNLFNLVKDKKLPVWAIENDMHSWAQLFLKYILSHPAVNCIIAGTSNPKNMAENITAGEGSLPGEKIKIKMVEFIESL